MSNYYKVNTDRMTITIDDSVKPTKQDEKDIAMYLSAKYKIRHKSTLRATEAKERANGLKKDEMLEKLAGDKAGLEKFNSFFTCKGVGKGFFAARKWFAEYMANKENN